MAARKRRHQMHVHQGCKGKISMQNIGRDPYETDVK